MWSGRQSTGVAAGASGGGGVGGEWERTTRGNGVPGRSRVLHPVGDKDVGLVRGLPVAVCRPDESLAVGGEHRKRIELRASGHLLQSCSVEVDEVEVEVAGGRRAPGSGEDDPPPLSK